MTTVIAPSTSTLWHTPLWLGEGDLRVQADAVSTLLAQPASGDCLGVDPARILTDTDQTRNFFASALRQVLGPATDAHVTLRVEYRGSGHSTGLQYSRAAWQGWYTLAAAGEQTDAPSGTLSLHDPRAGCAAVSVPGLPWGRPLTVKPQPGLAVLHPGWLGYSTTPLAAGHRLLVLSATLELDNRHPGQK